MGPRKGPASGGGRWIRESGAKGERRAAARCARKSRVWGGRAETESVASKRTEGS